MFGIPLHEAATATIRGRERLRAGERRALSLSFCCNDIGIIPALGAQPWCDLDHTRQAWSSHLAHARGGEFGQAVQRSMMVLRLLNFSPSGAVLAAPTAGLPEAVGAGRNWDYRFCWLRDASFILRAFLDLGSRDEAEAFFRWMIHATRLDAPNLRVLYDLFGRRNAGERRVDSLEGWRGSNPVTIGNRAQSQLQLDVRGEVLASALHYVREGGTFGPSTRSRLLELADAVCAEWTLPDNSLWEFRTGRRHHTHSKVMCWAALDATVRLCRRGVLEADPARYAIERDAIRETVLRHAIDPRRGCLTAAFGAAHMDAALLLLPRVGFLAADDPRMVATFEAVERDLGHGARMLRYPHGSDGLPGREGTFVACGFWAVDYLARAGRIDEARERMRALVADANDLGLMSEETDAGDGTMLGNFPQAFSHAGLVGAAMAIEEADGGRRPRGEMDPEDDDQAMERAL
ncbi:glycoside hydrolase family 15 protein [Rhodobacter sp. NSM]|uniref:glycoside hydrolase family 15 protein n=1 Tax=Rhodobacter sp. NSM TaxID=3457501 RepID=UPI003FD635BE